MIIKVKDREVELSYSLRIYIVFESMVNRAFNPTLTSDTIMLFLATLMASDPKCEVTLDDVIDMATSNPCLIDDFISWYTDRVKAIEAKKKTMRELK